jgi:glutathione synthase
MKLGFVVNDVLTEKEAYTTTRLARIAANRGHDVCLIGLADFSYRSHGKVYALGCRPRARDYTEDAEFLADVLEAAGERTAVPVEELDVLMLRSDPAGEGKTRPWAPHSGLLFAQLAAAQGVIVLNDPTHLTDASNKTYFQRFPERVRPVTCITRDSDEIRRFIEDQGGRGVIKPLQGSGGQGVFVVRSEDHSNLKQMIDAVTRDGYAIVQEYLPRAAEGDLRLFTLNGRALQVDGRYACFQRVSTDGDARSNVSAGGEARKAQPDADALMLAEVVGPKLVMDGMYLAGLDIVGDKMMEINVDTPGGLSAADELLGVDFSGHVISDLERKVRLRDDYGGMLDNTALATL